MVGTTLAHYRILEPLGEGGMGQVFRAHDEHLDRDVAVKVLSRGALSDSAARERFRREAHVLSRLSHPGVATVFDFATQDDVDFLVMEFVPGGTLEQRLRGGALPIDDVLRLGAEIADALEDAHRRGFLHRDLKPGNVVLTATGTTKLLDFGLARLLNDTRASGALTRSGTIVGSLPYMSPVQLRGDADDPRTDVYALGVLLYETSTGRRPFERPQPEALMFEIMHAAPTAARTVRPDLPADLDRLITACLSKDPGHRPISAGEVAAALRRIREQIRRGATADLGRDVIRSLAVLPLVNVSRDPTQEWFADGMTEAIISDLARLEALRVISRTSAMKYKGADKALPDIARELNVDGILEGSALLVGHRVRISLRLVSARDDDTLWAKRYDGDLEDVLDLQNRVAEAVAREIELQISPKEAERLAERRAVNPEAHVEWLKGTHAMANASPEAVAQSLRHFQRALDLDPLYAPAWAGLAGAHFSLAYRGVAPSAESIDRARQAALKALELDESLAQAHMALAQTETWDGDVSGAIRRVRRAVELNPGLPGPHTVLGRLLYCTGHFEEAQKEMRTALGIDPLSMLIHTAVGDAHYYARQYEASVVYYRKAIELDPRFDGAHTDLARSLEALGQFDDSRREYEAGVRLSGGVAGPNFGLAHLAASTGDMAEARRMLEHLIAERSRRVVSAWGISTLHAHLGDVDEAYRWLDVAIAERATGVLFLKVHPRMDPIRTDPRYPEYLKKVGLHDA